MWDVKMGMIMLATEVLNMGSNTLSKAAMAKGMSNYVFTTYTHALALFFLIPSAFLFHRKTPPPPITGSMLFRLFLLGALLCGCSILLYMGIRYSSPTLASAMNNLSPAYTFIMAIVFRMEMLNLRAQSTLFKSIGTIVSVSGAFIVIFYQGPPIIVPSSPTNPYLHTLLDQTQSSWAVGAFLLATSCTFLSLSYIVKTWIARDYHSEVLIISISFFFEAILAATITFIVENDSTVWTPRVGIEWISLLFGGIEVGIVNVVNTWACRKKGPVYVAMFKPLQMMIAIIMSVSFLRDTLYLGSVIGGAIIALGFYTVMKGKAAEEKPKESTHKREEHISEDENSSHRVHLLQDKTMDA